MFQVKTSGLIGTRELLLAYGVMPEKIFQKVSISPKLLDDTEMWMPYSRFLHFLYASARECGDPLLGCRLGLLQGVRQLGVLGDIMRRSATVGEAIHHLCAYFHTHNQGATVELKVHGQTSQLSFIIVESGHEGAREQYDLAAMVALQAMRLLCGEHWRPQITQLAHSEHGLRRTYEKFFLGPVAFNIERTSLLFPARDLERAVATSDQEARDSLIDRLRQEASERPLGTAATVQKLIRRALLNGNPTIDEVAGDLCIDKRTLQRQLAALGLRYQLLLEEARFDIACKYLADSDLSLTEVATLLCYGELSAFSRAFRKNAGCSPRLWRRQQLALAAPEF